MRAEERNRLIAGFMGARCECYVLSGTPCYAIRYPHLDHVGKSRARVYQTEEAAWLEFCRSAGHLHSWNNLGPLPLPAQRAQLHSGQLCGSVPGTTKGGTIESGEGGTALHFRLPVSLLPA